ncbi:MAG: hypothetical protein ACYS5V_12410, partial [Planctomycetota bacterium]
MRSFVAALMALCLVASSAALADDYTWTGVSSNDWTDIGNWDLGAAPGAADTAIFDINATVDIAAAASVADLDVTGGALIVNGADLSVANAVDYDGTGNGAMNAVLTGTAAVNVLGGTLRFNSLSTYTGGTTVSSGANLVVGAGAAVGTGPILVEAGGVMYLRGGGDGTDDITALNYVATLPGSPSLTVQGRFEPVGNNSSDGPWRS